MASRKPKTMLKCTRCSATADVSTNPNAWNGWVVLPAVICPDCVAKAIKQREEAAQKEAARVQMALSMLEGGQV